MPILEHCLLSGLFYLGLSERAQLLTGGFLQGGCARVVRGNPPPPPFFCGPKRKPKGQLPFCGSEKRHTRAARQRPRLFQPSPQERSSAWTAGLRLRGSLPKFHSAAWWFGLVGWRCSAVVSHAPSTRNGSSPNPKQLAKENLKWACLKTAWACVKMGFGPQHETS